MMKRLRQHHESTPLCGPRSKQGFTFTEVMVALLIFVLLTAFVANGIPVAFKTYQKVANASNAQVALSTTASALRDELGLATAVYQSGSDVYYQAPDGYWVRIAQPTGNQKGLQKHFYADVGNKPSSSETADSIPLIPESAIQGAVGTTLQVTSGAFAYADGVFTVKDLLVTETSSNDEIEGIDNYTVRAVLKPPVIT